jgi:hypothetical protein
VRGSSAVLRMVRPHLENVYEAATKAKRLSQDLAQLKSYAALAVPKASGRAAADESEHRHRRLLRTRSKRPRRSRTAERGYEFSPSHVDCLEILLVGVACSGEDLTTLQLDFMKNLLPAFSLDSRMLPNRGNS